jgi:hypothetical protein
LVLVGALVITLIIILKDDSGGDGPSPKPNPPTPDIVYDENPYNLDESSLKETDYQVSGVIKSPSSF